MAQTKRFSGGRKLSLFEKIILINALILPVEALAGLWLTGHNLENHHYLIDMTFIVLATLLGLLANILLLRASFRPLLNLLDTIRSITAGQTRTRASYLPTDTEIGELTLAFNGMLDKLDNFHRQQAIAILQAQEEERRRVALELHDESGQNITALLVHTEILQQMLHAMPESALTPAARIQLQKGLQQLTGLTQQTLESIRDLALQLRPSILDDLGLSAALRWLADDCRQRLHLSVDLHIALQYKETMGQIFPAHYETTLFRVAQECLTNVARHARASHVSIELLEERRSIILRIQDNGQGYDSTVRQKGLGISGMKERVALLDGECRLNSLPGKGTTVEVQLPLPESRPLAVKESLYV